MGRAPCCEKIGLKKGRWTAEEDVILMNYIKANGEGSWRSLPNNAGLLRCGKSCRLRWINYLSSDLKRGNISREEEETIIKLHASIGNRWSVIAGHLPGRTDNEIKNYWNSHLSRSIHSFRRINGDGNTVIMDLGEIVGGGRCKRRGGRTSRSAMKKNSAIGATRRERHDHKGGGLPTTLGQSESSTRGSGGSMGLKKDPHKASSGVPFGGPTAGEAQSRVVSHEGGLVSELLCPDQVLQSGLWNTNDQEIQSWFSCPSEEIESGFLGSSVGSWGWASNEERESGAWGAVSSLSEERGRGAMSLPREERDFGTTTTLGLNEERELITLERGVTNHLADVETVECDGGSLQTDRWVDWELEGMTEWLWGGETGETWSWLQWEDCGNDGELDQSRQQPLPVAPMWGCGGSDQVGALDSWLLSDVL